MSMLRALATNMAAVVSGKAMTAVAGLLMIMVLTRHLGPTEFGYYRTVLTYCAFAAVLADCGLYMINLRELARPGADTARVAGNTLALRLVSTGGMLADSGGCCLGHALRLDRQVGHIDRRRDLHLFIRKRLPDLRVPERPEASAQRRSRGCWCARYLGRGVALATLTHAGAIPMLGATLLGAALALGISWRLARRLVPFHLSFDLPLWRTFLVTGLPIAGAQILGMAMLRGDALLLSFYQPAADVGLYGVPSKLFEIATSVPYQFAGLMMPALTAGVRNGRQEFGGALRNARCECRLWSGRDTAPWRYSLLRFLH